MAHDVNQIIRLPAPLLSVDEQVFVVAENGCLDFANDYFKFIVMFEGECLHQVDDEPPRRFTSGDVIIFPCACRQRYWPARRNTSPRLHALRVLFDPAVLPPARPVGRMGRKSVDNEIDLAVFLRRTFREIHQLHCAGNPAVMELAREIRVEVEREAPGFRLRVAALCAEMVVMLARQLQQLAHHDTGRGQSPPVHLVSQSKEYMVRNLAQPLTLAKVAAHVRVSPEHLARSFKRATGQTVLEYLHGIRIEKAKDYLISSEKSLGEIAALTGFSTLALFSRGFKRHTGVNPSGYRRKVWTSRASFRVGEQGQNRALDSRGRAD